MVTREITENRSIDHNIDERRSILSTITEKFIAQKTNQNTTTCFQLQKQSTSVTFTPNINITATTESLSPIQVTGVSIPTICTLILVITEPLQVPTKNIRSSSDVYNEPDTSQRFKSQHNSFSVASHQFHYQNTANLPISQCKRTQRNIPMNNPITGSFYQIQNNQTVANQSIRANDQTSLLKTIITTVPTLSRPPLTPPNFDDTYSLGSTINNPFQTNTLLSSNANQCQTLYQTHISPKIFPPATLP